MNSQPSVLVAETQVIVLVTLKGKLRISGEEIEMPLAEFF
jgi:hypothetical protein